MFLCVTSQAPSSAFSISKVLHKKVRQSCRAFKWFDIYLLSEEFLQKISHTIFLRLQNLELQLVL